MKGFLKTVFDHRTPLRFKVFFGGIPVMLLGFVVMIVGWLLNSHSTVVMGKVLATAFVVAHYFFDSILPLLHDIRQWCRELRRSEVN